MLNMKLAGSFTWPQLLLNWTKQMLTICREAFCRGSWDEHVNNPGLPQILWQGVHESVLTSLGEDSKNRGIWNRSGRMIHLWKCWDAARVNTFKNVIQVVCEWLSQHRDLSHMMQRPRWSHIMPYIGSFQTTFLDNPGEDLVYFLQSLFQSLSGDRESKGSQHFWFLWCGTCDPNPM